mmetsp:Transcript_69914/g.166889  ORF Transcript_69914/g.166889 Transcript_69914/m.166889 type:complete len:278 (+) Transcript_69914:158-991(+)
MIHQRRGKHCQDHKHPGQYGQGLLGHMLLLASNGCDDHGEFADLREVDGGTSCRSKLPSAAIDGTENAHPARCHDHHRDDASTAEDMLCGARDLHTQGNKVQGYKEVTDVADGLADRWCTRGACQRSSRYQRRQLSGDIHEGQHGRSTHEETPAYEKDHSHLGRPCHRFHERAKHVFSIEERNADQGQHYCEGTGNSQEPGVVDVWLQCQNHDRPHVLENENSDGDLPSFCLGLIRILELLHHNHRGGHAAANGKIDRRKARPADGKPKVGQSSKDD